MRNVLTFVIVALLLANCDKAKTPSASSASSGDALQRKLQELAGSGATECGRLKSQAQDQVEAASACAMGAAKKKQSFYVAYELPGLIVALAGDSSGKLFSVQQEQPGNAGELVATPCPAELRIAQSGRVTCTSPGSMGGSMMGGANPHGGMPAEGSANPHGGMSMPPGGVPNPHGGGSSNLPSAHPKPAP
jgi:hypothetical protein